MSRYETFDRSRLQLRSLEERGCDLWESNVVELASPKQPLDCDSLRQVALAIREARLNDRPVVVMIGGHPIKLGLSLVLIDLMERGLVTHLATNGAGLIHDFELALHGGTSEDVAKWIKIGQFGLWQETGRLNDIVTAAASNDEGFGEGLGRAIESQKLPHRDISIAAAGWRCGVPVTSHVSIGSDIIHGYANCDGPALGKVTHTDFLILVQAIQNLEGGVFLNIGSAVTGPEVYLKALSMARNLARQSNEEICHFTTAVFDIVDLPEDWQKGPGPRPQGSGLQNPSHQAADIHGEAATSIVQPHPLYYYRPWKTILIRTVADGGTSHYIKGDHRDTIPTLWHLLTNDEK